MVSISEATPPLGNTQSPLLEKDYFQALPLHISMKKLRKENSNREFYGASGYRCDIGSITGFMIRK